MLTEHGMHSSTRASAFALGDTSQEAVQWFLQQMVKAAGGLTCCMSI